MPLSPSSNISGKGLGKPCAQMSITPSHGQSRHTQTRALHSQLDRGWELTWLVLVVCAWLVLACLPSAMWCVICSTLSSADQRQMLCCVSLCDSTRHSSKRRKRSVNSIPCTHTAGSDRRKRWRCAHALIFCISCFVGCCGVQLYSLEIPATAAAFHKLVRQGVYKQLRPSLDAHTTWLQDEGKLGDETQAKIKREGTIHTQLTSVAHQTSAQPIALLVCWLSMCSFVCLSLLICCWLCCDVLLCYVVASSSCGMLRSFKWPKARTKTRDCRATCPDTCPQPSRRMSSSRSHNAQHTSDGTRPRRRMTRTGWADVWTSLSCVCALSCVCDVSVSPVVCRPVTSSRSVRMLLLIPRRFALSDLCILLHCRASKRHRCRHRRKSPRAAPAAAATQPWRSRARRRTLKNPTSKTRTKTKSNPQMTSKRRPEREQSHTSHRTSRSTNIRV